jgi:DNA-directed RNA polymerase specialized sigma subunit
MRRWGEVYNHVHDIELLKKAKKGDETAWEVFFKTHEPIVRRHVWKVLKRYPKLSSHKDDLYQEGWTAIVEAVRITDFRRLKGPYAVPKLHKYFNIWVKGRVLRTAYEILERLSWELEEVNAYWDEESL